MAGPRASVLRVPDKGVAHFVFVLWSVNVQSQAAIIIPRGRLSHGPVLTKLPIAYIIPAVLLHGEGSDARFLR
ncbi:hypothetical protein E2C01_075187 [Portunus trituberculatus]|uniref:Uncharacterized protein n=1 Tax=Portunus trituberculatus TaxID=210409 RepID=A0A5B7IJE0_PORTR|nr:hypothetical protein [Portunus trituberculatus]